MCLSHRKSPSPMYWQQSQTPGSQNLLSVGLPCTFLCFLLMARSLGDSGELHVVHIQGFPKDNVIALVVGRFAVPGSTGLRLCSKDSGNPNCAEPGRINRIANLHVQRPSFLFRCRSSRVQ